MKKIVLIISILVLLTVSIFIWSYQAEIHFYFYKKRVVFWSENVQIRVSDFQGKPDNKSSENIYWFHMMYLKSNNIIDAKVWTVFDQKKSWIKDTTDFDNLMKMQNLRFDLYEYYTRKFNKEIDKIRYNSDIRFEDLEKIGERIYNELLITEDSIYKTQLPRKDAIRLWQNKINKRLNID